MSDVALTREQLKEQIQQLRARVAELEAARQPGQLELDYQMLLNSMLDGFAIHEIICDPAGKPVDYRFLAVNPSFERMTGLTADQVVGKTVREVIPDIEEHWIETYGRVALTGEPVRFESHAAALGKYFEVVAFRPKRNHFFCLFLDTTKRKRAEEALRQSEENLAITLDSIGDAVIATDKRGRIQRMNPIAAELTRWSDEEARGQSLATVFRIINAYTRSPVTDPVAMVLREGRVVGLANHTVLIARDGTERQIADSGAPIRNARGEIVGVVLVFRDVTEEYATRRALLESERRLQLLVNNLHVALVVCAPDGAVTLCNQAAQEMLGITADAGAGLAWEDPDWRFLREDGTRMPVAEYPVARVLAEEAPIRNLVMGIRPPGRDTIRWVLVNGFASRGRTGDLQQVVVTFLDISDRKRSEEEVRALSSQLEERVKQRTRDLEAANRELESFSYSVSHDLRGPLRAIDGFSKVLLEDYETALDDAGKDSLHRIRRGAQRMGDLIDDMLKLYRLTRGEINWESVDLSALAQQIAEELHRGCPQREIEFVIAPDLSARCDARLIAVVLENLLGNAVKFTSRQARARIEFGAAEIEGEGAFYVRDDGAGFDMAYSDKLFGAFQRLHDAAAFPGTGIGLATVQRIIHRHGGHVWAEGQENRGATFYFTI